MGIFRKQIIIAYCHFKDWNILNGFPKRYFVYNSCYLMIYGKCMKHGNLHYIYIWGNAWSLSMERDKHLWFNPLIMDFMNSLDYLEILKMFYLTVFYLGNLIENLIDKEWFWTTLSSWWLLCLFDNVFVTNLSLWTYYMNLEILKACFKTLRWLR